MDDVRPAAAPPAPRPSRRVPASAAVAVIGAMLIALGTALPWATVTTASGDEVSVRGIDTENGPIVLVIAIVLAVVVVTPVRQRVIASSSRRLIAASLAAGAVVIGALDVTEVRTVLEGLDQDPDVSSGAVGSGLVLTIIGGCASVAGCVSPRTSRGAAPR
ncbi:MAG: hypothetical protein AAGD18_05385 [Actinomycetota bacterium]